MEQSRKQNALKNSVVGLVSFGFSTILTFVSRTVFIRQLGVEYLGVSGLFSNILSVLALSDLGINTVMVYSLYKPIADGDTDQIAALISYFRKLYFAVAGVIALLGIVCIPILPLIVNGSKLPWSELIRYYVLILANSVCSYFAISKSTLIRADQKMRIIQVVQAVTLMVQHVVQIVVLIIWKNYTLYLCIPIGATLVNNVILTILANRMYPYILRVPKVSHIGPLKTAITENLKSTFLYKLGATIINSTDNILISVIVGTTVVGFYSNYHTIVAMVNAVIMILINAVMASIGNFYATQSIERKQSLFRLLLCFFYALTGFVSSCYLAVFDDFITIWLGQEFVMDTEFLLALVFTNALACMSHPLWITRESTGKFVNVKYTMLISAGLNLVLSILLGNLMGLAGIILATGLARLVTLFWYEPRILCKELFKLPVSMYWKYVARLLVAVVPCIAVGLMLHAFKTPNMMIIIGKVLIVGCVTLLSFFVVLKSSSDTQPIASICEKVPIVKKYF